MNEALFNRLPTDPEQSARPEVRAERLPREPEVSDAQVESPLVYAARIIEHLQRCQNGVEGVTQECLDEIAKSLGVTPLEMRQILEATGALKALQQIQQQMAQEMNALTTELNITAAEEEVPFDN